jgi:type II secretory pathway pseudopilin PulG
MSKENVHEYLFVLIMIIIVGLVAYWNFGISQQRARDNQRRDSISRLADALAMFYDDYGRYPSADPRNGLIQECGGNGQSKDCPWGAKFLDYLELPNDPFPTRHFYYQADALGTKYKILAAMEISSSVDIKGKNDLPLCGDAQCNYGQASDNLSIVEPL